MRCIVARRKTGHSIETMKKSVQNRKSAAGQRRKEKREKRVKSEKIPGAIASSMKFGALKQRNWRFTNRELIGDVNGSVNFSTTRFLLNPGISESFPILSGESVKWEQYRFHSLKFVYLNRVGTNTSGSVILSPEYNVRDRPPTTEREAASNKDAEEGATYAPFECRLDVNSMFPHGPRKLIRSAFVAGDLNLYDVGSLYVSTTGEADASAVGKLWVEYDIELFVPQNSPSDESGPSYTNWFQRSAAQTFATGVGSVVDFDAPTNNPLLISEAAGVITPRAGCYRVSFAGSFVDSVNEQFACLVELRKNSVAVTNSFEVQTGLAGGTINSNPQAVIACNGTDTIDVNVTLTGAAGTLTSRANSVGLIITPA